jgi:hypothetical protein
VKQSIRLALLEKELRHLGARGILVQCYIDPSDIRDDGWPRSSARVPKDPGIVVSFHNRKGESLSFPCDTYDSWEDNLYAIALSLEALRSVDRYGVTRSEEQYQGWKRLASPGRENHLDSTWAIGHLAHLAETTVSALRGNRAAIDLAYRSAVRKCHPDTGGSTEAFQMLQQAMNLLRAA